MSVQHDTTGTERALGRVLSVGTWISTILLAAGLLLAPALPPAGLLLHAGIIVLFATPALRVAVSIVTFAARGEWWFVLCSSTVLALLVIGILVA